MNELNYLSLYKTIFEQIELPDNAVVADLGCRDASFLVALNDSFTDKIKSAVGVDITDKGFKNLKYGKPIKLRVMNCSKKLDIPDNTFDFVFTKDMFECVSDKNFLVKEIHRILKPGGTVVSVNCDWDSIVYNGENKELLTKVIHAYATTKQPWMDDIDSWIGRRMYGFIKKIQVQFLKKRMKCLLIILNSPKAKVNIFFQSLIIFIKELNCKLIFRGCNLSNYHNET